MYVSGYACVVEILRKRNAHLFTKSSSKKATRVVLIVLPWCETRLAEMSCYALASLRSPLANDITDVLLTADREINGSIVINTDLIIYGL